MRGCGIPRGFWIKPGGSVDRVEGIIIETFVILCQYNSQIHRVPAGRIVTNKQTNTTQNIVVALQPIMGTYKFMMGTYKMQVMHKFVLV
jgi:hypothetical protein